MIWIWLGLILYALFLAPSEGFSTDPIIRQLVTGDVDAVDPLVVTVFYFLGLFPLLFASLLLGSFILGAFSLLPYFFLRKTGTVPSQSAPSLFHKTLRSNVFNILLILMAVASLSFLLGGFSLSDYGIAFRDSKLVSVMTADFLVLVWLSSYTMKHIYGVKHFNFLSFIPVIGPVMLRWKKQNGRNSNVYKDTERTERHDD
ncbi:hypothetical protein LS684_23565 (plasmid) [Cytobacillus spongiae]|uniref:hypothetical protein n=1 Tax=Cytobacillus spongiae TaxID=2901381 RepID=UPI001F32EA52|nr:hypothetical protein [Cytobacillus spongiae]UII58568.1 hypothetical protein LS684_23565 [Cytobacillus spongiae]